MAFTIHFVSRRARQSYKYIVDRLFSSSNASVGFVGLGNMGLPMATNLAKNWNIIAFDVNENSTNQAAQAGIKKADSVEQIGASGCSIIFTMLPGCNAVNHVTPLLLDSTSASSSVVFVDCSTVHPTTSRRWSDQIAAKGHARIDAPVSGGVKVSEHDENSTELICLKQFIEMAQFIAFSLATGSTRWNVNIYGGLRRQTGFGENPTTF